MTKPTRTDHGNDDGSWFLEAIGVKKRAPSPIESVALLERDNTEVLTPVEGTGRSFVAPWKDANYRTAMFSGDPGTSLSSFDPVPAAPPIPSNIITTKDPGDGEAAAMDVDNRLLAPPLQTRRPFRWATIAAALVAVAVIGAAFLWLPQAAENAALARRQTYHDASLQVRDFLPTAQASLDVVTKPSSSDGALGTVIPVVSELSSHASDLGAVAAEALPLTLPVVRAGAVDALGPLRDRSAILASDSAEVARQMGHSYVYRTSLPQLLDVGDLPSVATTNEINALSVSLASSLAENASLVADLPSSAVFDGVRSSANDAVADYGRWQDEYLDALANNDAAGADAAIRQIRETRAGILAVTERTLLEFREEMDDRIVSLAGQFDDHLIDLAR